GRGQRFPASVLQRPYQPGPCLSELARRPGCPAAFLLTGLGNGRGARNLCRRVWRDLAQARHDPYRAGVAVRLRAARDAAADHQPAVLLANAAGAERHARTAREGGRDPAVAAVAGSRVGPPADSSLASWGGNGRRWGGGGKAGSN